MEKEDVGILEEARFSLVWEADLETEPGAECDLGQWRGGPEVLWKHRETSDLSPSRGIRAGSTEEVTLPGTPLQGG